MRTDPDAPKHRGITWLILDMHQPGVEVRPMRTIDGESHFCEVFLTDARVPVGEPGRRRERRLAGHQRDAALRARHRVRPAHHHDAVAAPRRSSRWRSRSPTDGGAAWDDPALRAQVGRLEANIDGLWRMTQRGITEAEATGMPAPSGSAVKLRFSELSQELSELAVRVLGPPCHRLASTVDGIDGVEAARAYLWSLQYTIAAGTSQIQRNLIAERILGMPKGR